MQRIVGLLGKNTEGPWIATGNLKRPKLRVAGFGDRLIVQQMHRTMDEDRVEVIDIEGDGVHDLPPATLMKILQTGSTSIHCVFLG